MKRIIFATAAALSVAILTGCGHNAITYGKGLGFRAGIDPEHFSADVNFVYGEQITIAGRDEIEDLINRELFAR